MECLCKKYIYLNRCRLFEVVKSLRNKTLTENKDQKIDSNYYSSLNYTKLCWVGCNKRWQLTVSSVSKKLFGSEINSFKIKLSSVIICF